MDEVTGVQALERKHPALPVLPGPVLRREFEYIRHGTLSWFINVDVVSGHVIEPSWGPTRGEEDALAHLQRQFRLGGKGHRLRHTATLAACPILSPGLGQIQLGADRPMQRLAGARIIYYVTSR